MEMFNKQKFESYMQRSRGKINIEWSFILD